MSPRMRNAVVAAEIIGTWLLAAVLSIVFAYCVGGVVEHALSKKWNAGQEIAAGLMLTLLAIIVYCVIAGIYLDLRNHYRGEP